MLRFDRKQNRLSLVSKCLLNPRSFIGDAFQSSTFCPIIMKLHDIDRSFESGKGGNEKTNVAAIFINCQINVKEL